MKLPFVSRERYEEQTARLATVEAALLTAEERATTRHAAEVERLRATYEKVIETQGNAQKAALEQMMNLIQFGQPERTEAVVEEREPDAATRVQRRVTDETLDVAVARLREEYSRIGVPVTDEELRTEARSMMLGAPWRPPESLAGILRD